MVVVPETGCILLAPDIPHDVAAIISCAVTTGFGRLSTMPSLASTASASTRSRQPDCRCRHCYAVDRNPLKKALALSSGATHFLVASEGDLVNQVHRLTHGRGADSTIECTGNPAAMASAYVMTRPAGTVVMVGIPSKEHRSRFRGQVCRAQRKELSVRSMAAETRSETCSVYSSCTPMGNSTSTSRLEPRSDWAISTRRSTVWKTGIANKTVICF